MSLGHHFHRLNLNQQLRGEMLFIPVPKRLFSLTRNTFSLPQKQPSHAAAEKDATDQSTEQFMSSTDSWPTRNGTRFGHGVSQRHILGAREVSGGSCDSGSRTAYRLGQGTGSEESWTLIPSPPPTHCVTWDKIFHLHLPLFPPLHNGVNASYSLL